MSYILEALTKSEQARRQVPAAAGASLMPVVGEEAQERRFWPYVLAAALAANAGVFWLRQPAPAQDMALAVPPKLAQASPEPAPPAALPAPAPMPGPPAARPLPPRALQHHAQLAAPAAKSPEPAKPSAAPTAQTRQDVPKQAAVPAPPAKLAASPLAATRQAAPPEDTAPELPPLAVAGFIRDEGAGGMVIVNDKLLREGDEVTPGLKLEKILDDGLVFDYKGQRIRR